MEQIITDINSAFCQEFTLIISILIYLLSAVFIGKYFYKASKWVAVAAIAIVILSTQKAQISPNYYAFNGAFLSNFYVVFIKTMIILSSFFIILFSKNIVIKKRNKVFDFFILIFMATLGALCVVSSNDFITMFLSFELLGISTYLLTTFSKTFKSKEAGIKYAITGCVATGVMLFGISYIYLGTGSLNFDVIYSVVRESSSLSPFFNIGCILCILGLCFKMGLVPFSSWLPDAYEGTSCNVAAFISLIPLFAAFGIVSRLIVFVFQYTPIAQLVLFVIGIASVYKGFLGMLKQNNIQRFMGYSTISQSGFIMLGFCLANPYATSTSLFYMICYIFMTVGIWAGIILFTNVTGKNNISDFKGLVYSSKSFAVVMAICLFSFAGLPLTCGFIAKVYLFAAIAQCAGLYTIFFIMVLLASAIGVYAYFRPVKEMFCVQQNDFYKSPKFYSPKITLYICVIAILFICICPDKIIQICQYVAYQL